MNFLRVGRALALSFAALLCSGQFSISHADPIPEPQSKIPDPGFYVVIAAYAASQEGYATRFTNKVATEGEPEVVYEFFPKKNMFFVYLAKFTELGAGIQDMRQTRREGKFDDAWVYCYRPNEIQLASSNTVISQPQETPGGQEEPPTLDEPVEVAQVEAEVETEGADDPEVNELKEIAVAQTDPEIPLGDYKLFFNVHHGRDRIDIPSIVQVIEPRRGQVVQVLGGNESHWIDAPSNLHTDAQLEAEVFGYRKMIHTFNLEEPVNDTTQYFVEVQGDSLIIDFDMVKYAKGDIFTMYNVYFFSHSSIMRPESRNELEQLLGMLTENPNYRIRIHGHTNGSNRIEDTRYHPPESTNYFSLTGAQVGGFSANKLSELRAEAVKVFLVGNGISEDRMELKGWGGKRPLYKKLDPQAIKNVRVEVEILDE